MIEEELTDKEKELLLERIEEVEQGRTRNFETMLKSIKKKRQFNPLGVRRGLRKK